MIIKDPTKTYTLNQFIDLQVRDDITYQNFSILNASETEPNIYYSIDNIIHKYIPDIKDSIQTVRIDEEDRLKYMYKPKLLTYDIYGATEMFFVLMAINGIHNIKDFSLSDYTFKALHKSDMFTFVSRVYNAEEDYLLLNRRNLNLL